MSRRMIVISMAVLVLVGCQSMPWQKSSKPTAELAPVEPTAGAPVAPVSTPDGLQLSPEQRFKDIPLPVGVKEDMERTFVFESSSVQVGRMVYTTRSDVVDLVNFFNRECPTAQWQLQNIVEAGSKTLFFAKPGKRLVIMVQNMGLTGRRVTITVTPDNGTTS